jgi:hypothetical protein
MEIAAASVKLVSGEIGSRIWEGTIGSRNYWRSWVRPQAFHLELSLKRWKGLGCSVVNNTYWIIHGSYLNWRKRCLGLSMPTRKWLVDLLGHRQMLRNFETHCKGSWSCQMIHVAGSYPLIARGFLHGLQAPDLGSSQKRHQDHYVFALLSN